MSESSERLRAPSDVLVELLERYEALDKQRHVATVEGDSTLRDVLQESIETTGTEFQNYQQQLANSFLLGLRLAADLDYATLLTLLDALPVFTQAKVIAAKIPQIQLDLTQLADWVQQLDERISRLENRQTWPARR